MIFYQILIMEETNPLDSRFPKKVFWQKTWQIPGTPWTICGYSKCAYRTAFYIKDLDMMLDAGPQNFKHPTTIFITHTHGDHIANLPFTLIATSGKDELVRIYAPAPAEPYMRRYIDTLFSTNAMIPMATQEETDNYYRYHGLVAGQKLSITIKKTNLHVDVFECDHGVPTISYGFTEPKQKLKPEYSDLPGKEIARLRKDGTEITREVLYKRFAYVCDTTIKVLETHPEILTYPVVFIECTFLYEDDLEMTSEKKHIHWKQLRPYVEENPEIIFMLFHFSERYSDKNIAEFFKKEKLANANWW